MEFFLKMFLASLKLTMQADKLMCGKMHKLKNSENKIRK
jgi:hypothetical protein